ncbi:DUF4190 domain-containing protein [Sinobaca sp. H24]|uniref:DUF4190 domain-containing protein n=1 Tax=Sinobaca sp. H24 TaxID=2923376 RepID=UPI002079B709|nr:DUF4190 domain-containing protein [Sinobaca sp. H24]
MAQEAEVNRDAIVAMVFGILSLFAPVIGIIFGVMAIIFGKNARKKIKAAQEKAWLWQLQELCPVSAAFYFLFISSLL